jgi:hypothetical protein
MAQPRAAPKKGIPFYKKVCSNRVREAKSAVGRAEGTKRSP